MSNPYRSNNSTQPFTRQHRPLGAQLAEASTGTVLTTVFENLARSTASLLRPTLLTLLAILLGLQQAACGPEPELAANDATDTTEAVKTASTETKMQQEAPAGDGASYAEHSPQVAPARIDTSNLQAGLRVFNCGNYVPPGNWGMCGSALFGESVLRIGNPHGRIAYAWVDYLQIWATIPPYSEYVLTRWFWGSELYVYIWEGNPGSIAVSH